MKTNEEMTKSVLNRVHEYDSAQKKRRAAVLRTAVPVCGAFAIAGAAALANFTAKPPVSGDNSAIVAGGESLTENGALSEQTNIDRPESSQSASSTSTSLSEPVSIPYNDGFSSEVDDRVKVGDNLKNLTLTEEEAIDYYNIDIFAIECCFPSFIRSESSFFIKTYPDGTVDDGNFVEYRNSESSELLCALFRKKLKWQPAAAYTPYDFAGTDVYFFKDSAESPETRAVFEVNGTQISLLYSGPNEKTLYNAIKVFVNEKGAEQISDTAPIITGGSDTAIYN